MARWFEDREGDLTDLDKFVQILRKGKCITGWCIGEEQSVTIEECKTEAEAIKIFDRIKKGCTSDLHYR